MSSPCTCEFSPSTFVNLVINCLLVKVSLMMDLQPVHYGLAAAATGTNSPRPKKEKQVKTLKKKKKKLQVFCFFFAAGFKKQHHKFK